VPFFLLHEGSLVQDDKGGRVGTLANAWNDAQQVQRGGVEISKGERKELKSVIVFQ
jgi:hypothetical protein